jgi:hypothetical protein
MCFRQRNGPGTKTLRQKAAGHVYTIREIKPMWLECQWKEAKWKVMIEKHVKDYNIFVGQIQVWVLLSHSWILLELEQKNDMIEKFLSGILELRSRSRLDFLCVSPPWLSQQLFWVEPRGCASSWVHSQMFGHIPAVAKPVSVIQ